MTETPSNSKRFYSEGIRPMFNGEYGNRDLAVPSSKLIRFEGQKKDYLWVQPGDILFIKSADHYVKALIQQGTQKKWTMRHCTIKDLTSILSDNDFIRLNKFYMINRTRFSHIDETNKILFLDDGFSVPISHRISRFIINLLAS
jgi:DNA-binding LytR/AlgR family response regulator